MQEKSKQDETSWIFQSRHHFIHPFQFQHISRPFDPLITSLHPLFGAAFNIFNTPKCSRANTQRVFSSLQNPAKKLTLLEDNLVLHHNWIPFNLFQQLFISECNMVVRIMVVNYSYIVFADHSFDFFSIMVTYIVI